MSIYYRKNKGSKGHARNRWIFDKLFAVLKYNKRYKTEPVPNKILIIVNGHFGDTLLATPVFREIKKVYPQAEITALTSKLAAPILIYNKNINKIIAMDFFWRKEHRNFTTFKEYLKLIKQLKKDKYDIGIAVQSELPNAILMYKAGITKRVAYFNLDGGRPFLTNPVLYPEKEMHESIANLALINTALHMKSTDNSPEIPVCKEDTALVNFFFDANNINEYICIVPGASSKLQSWNKENWKRVIEWMKMWHPDHKVILVGSSVDEELIDYLSLDNSNCIKLINFNLRVLSLLFKHSSCVVAQDGGPAVIASTVGAKLISLWGPNPLEHVAPLHYFRLIHHLLDCYPCMRQEKECKKSRGQRCMDLITTDEVKKAIDEAIA